MMFIGHKKNWNLLLNEAVKDRLPPAYLFYGATGIGKKLVTQALVQWFFCNKRGSKNESDSSQGFDFGSDSKNQLSNSIPCQTCEACKRVLENHHPDFYFIEPEGSSIKIDTIRSVQEKLIHAPLEASKKIVVINEVQEMTRSAANSLLKTLEEPPKDTLFILVARSLFQILPTIRSRCRLLYFSPPPLEEAADYFSKQWETPVEEMKDLLQLADGSPGMAQILADENYEETIQTLKGILTRKGESFIDLSHLAQELSRKEIDLILLLEILKKKYQRQIITKETFAPLTKIDILNRAQMDLDRNVNKTLVLENLFMELSG